MQKAYQLNNLNYILVIFKINTKYNKKLLGYNNNSSKKCKIYKYKII